MLTPLSEKMRELAKTRTDLPENWLAQAELFDEVAAGYFGTPQTSTVQRFVGTYARTRRMWCDATGEPLV